MRTVIVLAATTIGLAVWACAAWLAHTFVDVPFWVAFGAAGALSLLARNIRSAWQADR